jgi:amidophosphoribosyltransferase
MSGFFGCVSKKECVADVFYGTDYHSHLGTKRAGLAFYKNDGLFVRSIHSLENSYFRTKFEDELGKFADSHMGIGVISDTESQPITLTSHLGRFAVVTMGRVDNVQQITQQLLDDRVNFAELSDSTINATELAAILISREKSFEAGIRKVHQTIRGSCSFLILTDSGIYVCRDKMGRTPVVIGTNGHGYVAATESSSFTNLEYELIRDLDAGEAVFMTADGFRTVVPPGKKKQVCAFMWVYYGYPSSYYEGVNVELSRYNCGAELARRDDLEGMDYVAGIPDSGIGHAVGYSNEKCVPYKRAFVKYTPTWPRSFLPSNPKMRSLVAKMKLIPNKALTDGAKIIFLDDSIVRGTQLRDNVCKLFEAGAEQVHIRIACPPLVFPCTFLNFSASRSSNDLVTRRAICALEGTEEVSDAVLRQYADPDSEQYARMVERLRAEMGLSSLKFMRLDDLVRAIGLPKEHLCTHCWDNTGEM